MSKFVKAEMDGSLKINVQSELFEKVKQSHTWFKNRRMGGAMMLGLAASDIVGFIQIAEGTLTNQPLARVLIVIAFTASFEIAPLYLGYALSLKSYGFGKKIHNKIIVFCILAFLIGIIVNGIYRFTTMDIAYVRTFEDGTQVTLPVALPATVLLTFMPISTSIVNIVIGCLVFDPLYYDLVQLKKRLSVLQEKRRQLEVRIEEIEKDNELEIKAKKEIDTEYKNVKNELKIAKKSLKNYVKIISST